MAQKQRKNRGLKQQPQRIVEETNPPKGQRGDFVRITITLPPSAYEAIMKEAARRKICKEANPLASAIIREAVVSYLKVLHK
jgi:hypothetical protein